MVIELLLIILLSTLTTESITNHVVKNDIFYYPRLVFAKLPFFGKLVTCPTCFSQWAAWLSVGIFMWFFGWQVTLLNVVGGLFIGFAVQRLSNVLHDVMDYIYRKSLKHKLPD